MKPDPVVLIVSSAFGDGHAKVAQAIEQSFRSRGINRVHIVDLFGEVHPVLNGITRTFYLKSASYAPNLYGIMYNMTSGMKPDYPLGQFLHSMGKHKVRKFLNDLQPDLIIHTYPYLAASQLGIESADHIPVFTVLTDYCLHGRWLHPRTMKYFVASESIKQELMKARVAEERITVSGIPVRAAFAESADRSQLIRKHGLREDRRYILLSAGAYGVSVKVRKILKSVMEHTDFDSIVLCGNNQKLRLSMEDNYRNHERVHILGYTDEMHELMSVSSCLLTKAGGVTLTEAFALSLPVIVYCPLPGQEAGNAKALSRQRALYTASTEQELISCLRLLEMKPYREEITRQMNALSRKNAAGQIVSEVLETLEQRPSHAAQTLHPLQTKGKAKTAHGYR
ncbi:processive 1,2-diacylglycerol beta-glucosyltransferase [Paenibacillus forsythiae]|uniref:Processive 1,2-diacylglycerol beta-glucosyltransferase n=1 Tax=Paenibacillus forsythiae TaxID=365616 RepID=A0ABU3H643_9BACL|nr:glycosyltransferase [Paenibacillus forsythiae]MDT3426295.1 processive 1,2-diacylglycerol beta-glucosyltransferase [Paenibacillus forsythiae]